MEKTSPGLSTDQGNPGRQAGRCLPSCLEHRTDQGPPGEKEVEFNFLDQPQERELRFGGGKFTK